METSATMKVEDSMPKTATRVTSSDSVAINWDSELQLVSSLAKLQELERRIHELRQLVPSNDVDSLDAQMNLLFDKSVERFPDSADEASSTLDESTRTKMELVDGFISAWQNSDMKDVWAHVESQINDSDSHVLQPTGMWERDYDVLLDDLLRAEKTKEHQHSLEKEAAERSQAQASAESWKSILEQFEKRNTRGVKASVISQVTPKLLMALLKTGMIFSIQCVQLPDAEGSTEWMVSINAVPKRAPSKIEESIMQHVNSRPRKWDLAFLMDMISSYSDLKQTVCTKCNQLTDTSAQLPILRRVQAIPPAKPEDEGFVFDALHASCA
ncbi:hypothetical protein N7539_006746 [Penicillium diatomitis]|uniref:Uncharacterized protein n=1 Tax=Penicillium diatomitis TaxID=2819901 RepID=A0A9W9X2G5_9EURO|nr:uncharacterized protein N7539_006746 [Penicillium diatomitis]KAJ5480852.1 hypothetical protein N7539_006746 [Penicillium diatomitis]